MKIRLTKDYFNGTFHYKAGQTGHAEPLEQWEDAYLVEFDGYEKERMENKEQVDKFGEPFNVVEYECEVPPEYLEIID